MIEIDDRIIDLIVSRPLDIGLALTIGLYLSLGMLAALALYITYRVKNAI